MPISISPSCDRNSVVKDLVHWWISHAEAVQPLHGTGESLTTFLDCTLILRANILQF